MDQHPIPQDVTGFQFKLIGTMTVKQFGYVACGAIAAVVLYYLPINSAFGILAKVFLIPLLGASGVVVAFVPIEGRPVDIMTTNFVKALFSPNQYIYRRPGRRLSFSTVSFTKVAVVEKTVEQKAAQAKQLNDSENKEEKLRALLMNSHTGIKNDLDKKEAAFLKTLAPTLPKPEAEVTTKPTLKAVPVVKPLIKTLPKPTIAAPVFATKPAPTLPPAPALSSITAATPITETQESIELKETKLEQELTAAKLQEAATQIPAVHEIAHKKVASLEKQIKDIDAQKQRLDQELSNLQGQLSQQKNPAPMTPPPVAQPAASPLQDPQHVRTIPQDVTNKVGLPHVSDTPNVVVGIVKDPRGNTLSNILVEVKDKDSNPVRAFKTNPLGQFASATPLSTGTYTMELEDPKKLHRFDIIQITANNQIMLPIEVISHDAREELRQQLFAS